MAAAKTSVRDIVVIGASAGGIEALRALVAQLPAGFGAAIFVVVHVAADSPGMVPAILGRAGALPAAMAEDGAAYAPGRIYVAPPDRHLVLAQGQMRLSHGPKENRFRPAIDPLFRSAAEAFGPQVIGIVLSGALDDGTAGLWAIKERGGLAIVQEPREAAYPSMPRSALQYVAVDYRLTVAEMGRLLPQLAGAEIDNKEAAVPDKLQPDTRQPDKPPPDKLPPDRLESDKPQSEKLPPDNLPPDKLQIETRIARAENPLQAGVMTLGPPSPYTCPECSGVLLQLQEGSLLRFRCHTGHAYSLETLLAGISESIEQTLWQTVRTLEEQMLLLRHLGTHARAQQEEVLAQQLEVKAQTAEDQVQIVRQLALRNLNGGVV